MKDTTADIAALEERRYQAMLAADVDTLAEMLDDDAVYTHSSGAVDDKASYLDAMRSGRLVYRSVERTDEQIRDHGDATVVTGHVLMSVLLDGEARVVDSRFTVTYVRKNDRWSFVAWQSTPARA